MAGAILEVSWITPGTKGVEYEYLINVGTDKCPLVIGTVFRYIDRQIYCDTSSSVLFTVTRHYSKARVQGTWTGN